MAMTCKNGARECGGCMACQNEEPVLYDFDGDPIYEDETFYLIEGEYVSADNIMDFVDQYKMTARRGGVYG